MWSALEKLLDITKHWRRKHQQQRKDTLKIARLPNYLSPKNMQSLGSILLFILLLKSHLTEESGYNCSDFHNGAGTPLEECPPAKFMLKDHLVECFDGVRKGNDMKSKSQILYYFLYYLLGYLIHKNLLKTTTSIFRGNFWSVLVLE